MITAPSLLPPYSVFLLVHAWVAWCFLFFALLKRKIRNTLLLSGQSSAKQFTDEQSTAKQSTAKCNIDQFTTGQPTSEQRIHVPFA